NGSVEIKKTVNAPLTLDLLRNEPELVGHEIRNLLSSAGIKERRCVVGVPAAWVLTLHTALPDLADEDVQSFLELEAERGFPNSPDQLQVARSIVNTGSARYATQLAVLGDQVERFEAILAAAQLRPVQIVPAIAALPGAIADTGLGCLTAVVNEAGVTLLISAGGGIVGLRTLDHVIEAEGSERRLLTDAIARELRITLSQYPEDIRGSLRELRVVGAGDLAGQLADELGPRVKPLNLTARRLTTSNGAEHGLQVIGEPMLSGALSLAAQSLSATGDALNFLPPKPTLWQQISRKYSGKRLAYSGATAGAVAVVLVAMFLFQQFQLAGLRSEWRAMEKQVTELEELQADIRQFRPWNDANATSLGILRNITEAFPEEGSLTAKSVEIRQQSTVSVSGVTRDNAILLRTLDQLRATEGIAEVKVDTIRGTSPMQYTFNFQWRGNR
ncbi:MAG TPA: hypothetical protein DCY13_01895, partial [Verrucomicrobiales bacterium]|nr:hypothetical protein [Verrucomicrobiales bacterium]